MSSKTPSSAQTIESVVPEASDAELLWIVDALEPPFADQKTHIILAQGECLVDPDNNYREYSGEVRLSKDADGHWIYEGVTRWGPASQYRPREKVAFGGHDIAAATRAVNKIIDAKLQKGYESLLGGSGLVESARSRKCLEDLILG